MYSILFQQIPNPSTLPLLFVISEAGFLLLFLFEADVLPLFLLEAGLLGNLVIFSIEVNEAAILFKP